ncbi:TetR family transcriptional regulator [Actinorhabdospora filicis]|uniref:TetR family transcriptional regulator n=1 Tax=Actinorhabdospora filicis TaxID=1785913 RepID=A0A9W6SL78_9ACTN|nr:hypothetical protein [Actinorhabdospora filicis]GLZ77806.1 TetR family transcriptional regulator [Actinorhabdospora filicis]
MKSGGRAPSFTLADVIAAGVGMGLSDLTVQAVADALGVTTAAIYRHVTGRAELETLVGEAVFADLDLPDAAGDDAAAQLVAFGVSLREFTLARPGSAAYLQRLFPRGPSGVRLLEAQIRALGRRGYSPAAATALSSGVATVALGAVIAEEERSRVDADAARAAFEAMAASPLVREAVAGLPEHTPGDYFLLLITATATGLVALLPPGAAITPPTTTGIERSA